MFADSAGTVLREMIDRPQWILEVLVVTLPISLAWMLYEYLVKWPREDRLKQKQAEVEIEGAKLKRAKIEARKDRRPAKQDHGTKMEKVHDG